MSDDDDDFMFSYTADEIGLAWDRFLPIYDGLSSHPQNRSIYSDALTEENAEFFFLEFMEYIEPTFLRILIGDDIPSPRDMAAIPQTTCPGSGTYLKIALSLNRKLFRDIVYVGSAASKAATPGTQAGFDQRFAAHDRSWRGLGDATGPFVSATAGSTEHFVLKLVRIWQNPSPSWDWSNEEHRRIMAMSVFVEAVVQIWLSTSVKEENMVKGRVWEDATFVYQAGNQSYPLSEYRAVFGSLNTRLGTPERREYKRLKFRAWIASRTAEQKEAARLRRRELDSRPEAKARISQKRKARRDKRSPEKVIEDKQHRLELDNRPERKLKTSQTKKAKRAKRTPEEIKAESDYQKKVSPMYNERNRSDLEYVQWERDQQAITRSDPAWKKEASRKQKLRRSTPEYKAKAKAQQKDLKERKLAGTFVPREVKARATKGKKVKAVNPVKAKRGALEEVTTNIQQGSSRGDTVREQEEAGLGMRRRSAVSYKDGGSSEDESGDDYVSDDES